MQPVAPESAPHPADEQADGHDFRAAGQWATAGPWYVDVVDDKQRGRANVRGMPENTSYDYRGDAVATTGDSSFPAMSRADAEFIALARNNWDRLMAAWDFAEQHAKTSGDGPKCDCTACRATRAVAIGNRECPTCSWPSRETVGMVCQTCGTDYGGKSLS